MGAANYIDEIARDVVEASGGGRLEELPIVDLKVDDSPRVGGINEAHAEALAQVQDKLPPILVHSPTLRVIDGMHRVRAAQLRGEEVIRARLFEGEPGAAFVLAVHANIAHGLPLSLADREAAAARIIRSFPIWSDRAVAKASGLSDKTIGKIRASLISADVRPNGRLGRDGRVRPVDTTQARERAREILADRPNASLREVASTVGLSPATVHNLRRTMSQDTDPVREKGEIESREKTSRSGQTETTGVPRSSRYRVLLSLKRDPSLRLNHTGRGLLRWLEMQTRLPDSREKIVDWIPTHCVEQIALLARECATWWTCFAEHLERRRPDI